MYSIPYVLNVVQYSRTVTIRLTNEFRRETKLVSCVFKGLVTTRTNVRPLYVKMALICKNGVKVRVRVRVTVRIRVSVSSLYRYGPHFYR